MKKTYINLKKVLIASVVTLGIAIFVIISNSKNKDEYEKSTGVIEYFDTKFHDLPVRHKGDFRYLKIDTYPYVFEIYEPNSEPTKNNIDELKAGDVIDIYYYETSDTKNSQVNRYAQFIDMNNNPYFIRNGFQVQLGIVLIGLSIALSIFGYVLWKKRETELVKIKHCCFKSFDSA